MLGPNTTRDFHRRLYQGMLMSVIVHKRGTGQNQGTGTNLQLFNVRRKKIFYAGQNIEGTMTSHQWTTFQIPREELDRVGIDDLNVLDSITEDEGGDGYKWEFESDNEATVQLYRNFINVTVKRVE